MTIKRRQIPFGNDNKKAKATLQQKAEVTSTLTAALP
jgi:hypothetical protein